jgi:hypothetical protein
MTESDITDWLTAIGTAGALVATVTLFWVDRFQRQKKERRAQAVLVSGWADSVKPDEAVRLLHVLNMSDEPVYNVNIFLEDENKRDVTDNEAIVAQPITSNASLKNKRFLSILPPKQEVIWQVNRKKQGDSGQDTFPPDPGPRTVPRVGLLFNDRNSARWLRDWDGKVSPAAKEEDDPALHRAGKHADIGTPERIPRG